jgi:hypothetical protein
MRYVSSLQHADEAVAPSPVTQAQLDGGELVGGPPVVALAYHNPG